MSSEIDIVKKPNEKDSYTAEQIEEFARCMQDPIYFIEKYVHIRHPTKGRVPFILHPYQKEMINNFQKHRFNISMCGRQMGKTEASSAYLLWSAMFKPDFTILIVANKGVSALEITGRIRYMYENLEKHNWLRAGVKEYNKGSIEFDNGSRIIGRATTADSGRGLSISLLYIDEMSYIRPKIAKEFWSALQPTLSTGGACIITSTPSNDEDQFAQIWHSASRTIDEYGNEHPLGLGTNGFKAFKAIWSEHPERDEAWAETSMAQLGQAKFLRENCCEFVSFDATLIDSMVLKNLVSTQEMFKIGQVRWYDEPKPNHTYLVALDPAMGHSGEGDFAAIEVLEVPTMIQIAEWKHNKTPARGQIQVLLHILQYLNYVLTESSEQVGDPEIYWTIENNSVGEAALTVVEDTGEENFPGHFVHEPGRTASNGRRKGLTTTNSSKNRACSKLKSLVESNRININSKALITELKNFVATGPGFKAKSGETDDLVSAMLLCIRLLSIASKWNDDIGGAVSDALDLNEEPEDPMPMLF